MDFENHIRNYFQSNDYTKWSRFFKQTTRRLSNQKNLRLAARNKALKLLENLERTLKRKDISSFLENQDLKFAEGRYKVNVELSVVTDKTAMTGKTSEKFAKSLNNDHDIRGSENQDSITKTQTTINNEQEENKQEESKQEENKQEESEGGDVIVDESSTMCVKDILEDSIEVSSVIKEVTKIFLSKFPKTSIMDLRPKSKFSLFLDLELQKTILHEVFDEIDNYITDDIHEYLTSFFNEDFTAQGWDNAINNMDFNRCDSEHLKNIKKLIQETLPKFLKAFSLEDLNPLRDITILEKPHLNHGEIPLKGLGTRIRADGVGFLNDVVNYPIVCGEGARPGAPQKKSVDDDIKNASSMAVLYNNNVIEEADARRQLFTDLRIYGLTAFKTELSLTMMDFRSVHRLFEVDHFGLPKNWVDMPNFVWLYEAIIKWALCVNSTRNGLIEHRKKRRVSRYSEVGIAKKLASLRDQHE
ncbi:10298_t:CDS:2 [Ambispora leptoticha]|uniref:10298_t:CDS:1 n=1 Tax=Ambispora leptoticha TaxID=144679 RepID=A0A9N8W3S4_9GLOM|nr:10298_t:CDS:2 [Ambispora leptoticha]